MKDIYLPIGFYDSGLGGISVLKQTLKLLPRENYIYYGDAKNAPYGTKNEDEILKMSLECGEFLYNKKVKMIVIACNTATSIAVNIMREKYNIPIVSIEPAIKPALEFCQEGSVLVFATPATINQERYNNLLKKYDTNNKVINIECCGLAEIIEKGNFESVEIIDYITEKLVHITQNVQAIVMGCTHYSFISHIIKEIANKHLKGKCEIFDGMYGVANRVKNVLAEKNLNCNSNIGNVEFFSSDENISAHKYSHFLEF